MVSTLAACAASSPPAAETPAHRHSFEHADEWATKFDDPSRDAWQEPEHVVAAFGASQGMTIADVGAGTGYFEPHPSRAVGPKGKVLALDIEPDMVRHLRERTARERLDNVEAGQVAADDPGLHAAAVDPSIRGTTSRTVGHMQRD